MPILKPDDLPEITPELVGDLNRETLEKLALQVVDLALHLANRLNLNSGNSSCPPSGDDPYRRRAERKKAAADKHGRDDDAGDGDGASSASAPPPADKPPAKPSGKRPGQAGFWRTEPVVVSREVPHIPTCCEACGSPLGEGDPFRVDGAHCVYELERGDMRLGIVGEKHVYFAGRCACGHETVARPAEGRRAKSPKRKRDLVATERCLVGPMLATFIAALAKRCRLSRAKVQEFLRDWLGLSLGVATINRCIHEFGLASEPVALDLIEELRQAEIVHLDETPWYQAGALLWLWVAVSNTVVVFHIGSRAKGELAALIGESFIGWLVTDGYVAYRDHPRRQRCLAHLIRKAVALATGFYRSGSQFGHDLARDLRGLIRAVAEGADESRVKRLMAKIKWGCQCNRYEVEEKVRALAREILNDWDAVMAFVNDPNLPATNNDAERALRHAVIARRLSFGTRTDEGSRFYAAGLSVIETCRKRGIDVWNYVHGLIAATRAGLPHPPIPHPAAA